MKSGTHFHFKKFSISQDRTAHKIGTDGVLLGAWVNISNVNRVLDIGTGTGIIPIMLAQRSDATTIIEAVEIDRDTADQAKQNANVSPWPEKIKVHHCAIQNFITDFKYDLIVTNPPYFQNSYRAPEKRRTQARHTDTLPYKELIEATKHLLTDQGRLALILPPTEAALFVEMARQNTLHVIRECSFRSRKHKPIERCLLELSRDEFVPLKEELVLYDEGENWSETYRKLTRDFYLKA